ncbi:biotin--[acetyl-CoA-carboxylase] ligase [Aquibacillus salsiterrae]|uniref:Bifunctional ligase/repressor BirA n=1 Tax=Aquibacillus salsiterrae TaxID=2950439 RepID=A0A9X3WDC7_9BACI|nr:biotin--[acetyl-CoA-carboxylase] ligase [Aquibacillus salsiterrae]MDC3415354.1 biotin--[acetyl-CoA-carboxylase] ligase [Aquibacillus salsiterrae]
MESTRNKLIDILNVHKNSFISGQQLSNQLNISRTAVWKHMRELEKDGYVIEAAPRKGYRIVESPKKVSSNTIHWGLQTKWLGKEVVHKHRVPSTQTVAHQQALNGSSHGTVVIADQQTKGKGRLNRKWYSENDDGVWMSVVLRPNIPPNQAPQLTLLAATVLANVLTKLKIPEVGIKWPNDILIGDKKVAGILTEMQAEHDQIHYLVLGIGLNVNQSSDTFPDEVKDIATSLKLASNQSYSIRQLIQDILFEFEKSYDVYMSDGFTSIKQNWERFGYKMGEKVAINSGNRTWTATLHGIEADGSLLVSNDDGSHERLYSAEINWKGGNVVEE